MSKHIAYLSIGSNLGDRSAHIRAALQELVCDGMETIKVSTVYETEPVGFGDQPWFLNVALEVRTCLEPETLLDCCQEIESAHGRLRTFTDAPRTLDIDILLYDDLRVSLPRLKIPHPRMAERRFVLVPMAEIAGDVLHPALGLDFRTLLARCEDLSQVRRHSAGGFV